MALTKIGSASRNRLVPLVGNQITTDDFGMRVGKVRYRWPDAATAYLQRPKPGTPSVAGLKEYDGMLADESLVVRGPADAAFIDVTYYGIDRSWKILPVRSHDMAYWQLKNNLEGDFAALVGATSLPGIPIPHPTLTYQFSDTKAQTQLGTYDTPPNAPEISDYTYHMLVEVLGASGLSTYDVAIRFSPSPRGWICLRDDALPLAGGQLFRIEQQWKRLLFFSGVTVTGA